MAASLFDRPVLIRGGGEMATGIAHRLTRCRFRVLITEIAAPTAVRRTVAFAEAAYTGMQTVEGVTAVRVDDPELATSLWERGLIPLVIDPEAQIRQALRPGVVVDAIMAKKNTGTRCSDAPLVIGVGPGFIAGGDVHAVVESNRGYHLGRVLWKGAAEPDTGTPAPVEGYAEARLLRAPRNGRFRAVREIGDLVAAGEEVGEVDGTPVVARISGLVRGLLRDGISVHEGSKTGDVDPRNERGYCYLISDKARAIAGGVLEAMLHGLNRPPSWP